MQTVWNKKILEKSFTRKLEKRNDKLSMSTWTVCWFSEASHQQQLNLSPKKVTLWTTVDYARYNEVAYMWINFFVIRWSAWREKLIEILILPISEMWRISKSFTVPSSGECWVFKSHKPQFLGETEEFISKLCQNGFFPPADFSRFAQLVFD